MAGKSKPERLLGQRIRELRKKRGLTQEELGDKAGINYKYLGSIERGLENPSFKHLVRIARAVNVELPELFDFDHLEPGREKLIKDLHLLLDHAKDPELRLAHKIIRSLTK